MLNQRRLHPGEQRDPAVSCMYLFAQSTLVIGLCPFIKGNVIRRHQKQIYFRCNELFLYQLLIHLLYYCPVFVIFDLERVGTNQKQAIKDNSDNLCVILSELLQLFCWPQ